LQSLRLTEERRIFIQYLNPEILSIYGYNHRELTGDLYSQILKLTIYALLFSTDSLIMPASYLFEVGVIDRFLKDVDPLRAAGVLQFASSTPDLSRYASKKKQEYRDELVLFPGYRDEIEPPPEQRKRMTWIPRTNRSSSADISIAWKDELYKPQGFWRKIIEKRYPQLRLLPSKVETAIEAVPERLEDRAFIARYAEALLPFDLQPDEQTQEAMLISRSYLESYLEELDAIIITDTPIGQLSCGLESWSNGHLRTVSHRALRSFFNGINLTNEIEHMLGWNSLLQLRDEFIFKWLVNLIIRDSVVGSKTLEEAIVLSRFDPRARFSIGVGHRPLDTILSQLNRLFDTVQPFLKGISTESGDLLAETMPDSPPKSKTRRRRKRGGSIMKTKRVIRIVVASPSDVKAERRALAAVIQELNHGIAAERGLILELTMWETDAYPGFHPEGPQGLIDKVLNIEDCDVLIGVFWKRFGTPIASGETGTEHEILTAVTAWEKNRKPQIMMYFNEKSYTPKTSEEVDQWGRVLDFKKKFPKEGLWWAYKGKAEFEKMVRLHLTLWLRDLPADY
jgi:hypothetical protein